MTAVSWHHVERQPGGIAARADKVAFALHEAADAVVGRFLGCGLKPEGMVKIDQTGGRAAIRHREGQPVAFYVLAVLAGDVAVRIMAPTLARAPISDAKLLRLARIMRAVPVEAEKVPEHATIDLETDAAVAVALLAMDRTRPPGVILQGYRQGEAEAERLVHVCRRGIERVTTALIERGELTGLEVEAVCLPAPPL